jgi:hypothetical protein
MGTEPITDQGPAMSQGSSAPGFDNTASEEPTTAGAALDCDTIDQNDDVTVVVPRGFARLCYSQDHVLLRALTMVGIAAVGFTATGIVKLAIVHHRASSQIQEGPIAAATVTATTNPATDLPPASIPVATAPAQAAKLGTAGPTLVASRAESATGRAVAVPRLGDSKAVKDAPQVTVAGKVDLAMCHAALAKRDTGAITQACGRALEVDASLAAPILAWAKRELDRGNVSVAAIWARRVLDTDDHWADAYLIVGVAEQEARHASTAKAAYRRYLELAPKGRYVRDVRSSIAAL